MKVILFALLVAFCFVILPTSYADEGMWTFDNPPLKAGKRNTTLSRRKPGWITFGWRPSESAPSARVRLFRPMD